MNLKVERQKRGWKQIGGFFFVFVHSDFFSDAATVRFLHYLHPPCNDNRTAVNLACGLHPRAGEAYLHRPVKQLSRAEIYRAYQKR